MQGRPMGLVGAMVPTRYVGGALGGPPTAGTYQVGDFSIDPLGSEFVCTVAGTPGTWVEVGGHNTGTQDVATSPAEVSASTAYGDLTTFGPSVTVTLRGSGLALVIVSASITQPGGAGRGGLMSYDTGGGAADANAAGFITGASVADIMYRLERTTLDTGTPFASTTYTAKYRSVATAGASFNDRRITVVAL